MSIWNLSFFFACLGGVFVYALKIGFSVYKKKFVYKTDFSCTKTGVLDTNSRLRNEQNVYNTDEMSKL